MALLQVNDFHEDVYKETGIAAEKENSRAKNNRVAAKTADGIAEDNKARRKRLIERCGKRIIPDDVKAIDAARLIRDDRDAQLAISSEQ